MSGDLTYQGDVHAACSWAYDLDNNGSIEQAALLRRLLNRLITAESPRHAPDGVLGCTVHGCACKGGWYDRQGFAVQNDDDGLERRLDVFVAYDGHAVCTCHGTAYSDAHGVERFTCALRLASPDTPVHP